MREREAVDWKAAEWQRIRARRTNAFRGTIADDEDSSPKETEPTNLVGLSLSGGGIRSAIYNDGFLQGLSHRGFLRYVDYLCSVSGGGYIAGHLISQARDPADESGPAFHDDQARANLGRDPVNGRINAQRLAGVGGYLSRTMDFLPSYLWSFFFSCAFYLGMVGIVATLAALFWRSFDDPTFRDLYFETLQLNFGNELTVAFIPVITLVALATMGEVAFSLWRLLFGFGRPIPKKLHLVVRKTSLVLIVLAILTSVAIFIGNGKTNISSNANGDLLLNHYAQFLAVAAGVIQILVFLGRDRLFRSERAEATRWQKHLQRSITTVVLMFAIFSMVHLMGREDISGYTQNRDPHLVRGDVTNWYALDELFAEYEFRELGIRHDQELDDLDPNDKLPSELKPPSKWFTYLAMGRAGLGFDRWKRDIDSSRPPSPLQVETTQAPWSLWRRIAGACHAYRLAMFPASKAVGNAPEEPSQVVFRPYDVDNQSIRQTVAVAYENFQIANDLRDEHLTKWNRFLENASFTKFLLAGSQSVAASANANSSQPVSSESNNGDAVVSEGPIERGYLVPYDQFVAGMSAPSITPAKRKSILNSIRHLQLDSTLTSRDELFSERLAKATTNRLLLEVLLPSVIQDHQIPSTLVVPPHDQRARRRWLCFWAVLTFIGMLGGLGQNHIATVFHFYRQQLGTNFLVATHDPTRQFCDKELYELNPTDDGLPYPLFLAATLEPSTCNGSYHVDARPFVFSPLFCGRFDTDGGPIPSKQVSFSSSPTSQAVTLGDAITLSGAAVTPLMSGNRWLSVILDFFNTGIGQRLRRLDRTGHEIQRPWTWPIVISTCVIAGSSIATYTLIGLDPIMGVVTALLTCLTCYCVVMRIGSPGLIRSLVFPHNQDVNARRRTDDGRSFYVADGGFCDYLGVSELLRRRCELIVVSDTGANIGNDPLGTLAQMCETASQELGIRFLDLDHEAPIDFGRLKLTEQRLVHQPYLCMRIRYPENTSDGETAVREGRLFYCQMSITDSDPIEIQHIRNRFPSFPDEPTVNQFYSDEQVSAYRALGYHIANRLCNELQSWHSEPTKLAAASDATPTAPILAEPPTVAIDNVKVDSTTTVSPEEQRKAAGAPPVGQDTESSKRNDVARFRNSLLDGVAAAACDQSNRIGLQQPLFDVLKERLLTGYRLACYEEHSYRNDDIFSEAIWMNSTFAFPAFRGVVGRVMSLDLISNGLPDRFLSAYEHSADLRSAYRTAVTCDVNSLNANVDCFCEVIWSAITTIIEHVSPRARRSFSPRQQRLLLAAHLTNLATSCQEIHRGRPHSAFQIGGRDKLINLCHAFAEAIGRTMDAGTGNGLDAEKLFDTLDQIIAELIELERSVFQGGEHVTTISFAQCMTTMWGRIVRQHHDTAGTQDDAERKQLLTHVLRQVLAAKTEGQPEDLYAVRRFATEFQITELRRKLDIGLSRTRVAMIRDALVKLWCVGYFEAGELQSGMDFPSAPSTPGAASRFEPQPPDDSPQPNKGSGQSKKKG